MLHTRMTEENEEEELFGKLIASKLKKIPKDKQSIVEGRIFNEMLDCLAEFGSKDC